MSLLINSDIQSVHVNLACRFAAGRTAPPRARRQISDSIKSISSKASPVSHKFQRLGANQPQLIRRLCYRSDLQMTFDLCAKHYTIGPNNLGNRTSARSNLDQAALSIPLSFDNRAGVVIRPQLNMPMRKSTLIATLIATAVCFTSATAVAQQLEDQFDSVTPSPAPYSSMRLAGGGTLPREQLLGKVVLVNFWATWCPPCVEELPTMQNAWDKYSTDDFEIIAVAVAETDSAVTDFLSRLDTKLKFPLALDENLAIFNAWNVRGLPTSFLVDRQGNIRHKAVGGRNFDSANIDGIIRALIEP